MLHYTNNVGHKAISSQLIWCFMAAQPPGNHPFGTYFTTLRPCRSLCARLRIPKQKTEYVFCFGDEDGLLRLDGGRGAYVWYSAQDHYVPELPQVYDGISEELP